MNSSLLIPNRSMGGDRDDDQTSNPVEGDGNDDLIFSVFAFHCSFPLQERKMSTAVRPSRHLDLGRAVFRVAVVAVAVAVVVAALR